MNDRQIRFLESYKFLKWQSTDSSNIEAIKYTRTTQKLRIEFKSGSIYEYDYVTEALYNRLLSASSVGSFFYWNIREKPGKHPYSQIS
jgi:hypothetical protein